MGHQRTGDDQLYSIRKQLKRRGLTKFRHFPASWSGCRTLKLDMSGQVVMALFQFS
jgi:hypothetical protein